jgi:hypothetical protein
VKHQFNIDLDDDSDEYRYLMSCARIRGIRMQPFLRRLIASIARDQLVLSILDDESSRRLRKGEWRHPEVVARGGRRK